MIRLLVNVTGLLLLMVTCLQISYLGVKNYLRYRSFSKESKTVHHQLVALTHQQNNYVEMLNRSSDPKFWELEAKQRLGLSYKNEIIYKIHFER